MLGTGKHWQQTINGITKIKTGRIGEELQTLGSNYKYWLTLWGSGEILGINYKHWLNIVVLRQTLGRSYKHCGAAGKLWGNFGETLGATGYWVLGTGKKRLKGLLRLTLWSSGETTKNIDKRGNFGEHYKHWGAMAGAGARSLFLLKVS